MTMQRVWNGPDPEDIIAWTVVQAGHKIGRMFWSKLTQVGITPTQFGVLLLLDKQPGTSNADLARHVHVAPQSMSELITSLVAEDLIEKPPKLPKGKKRELSITNQGRKKLLECQQVIESIEESLPLDTAEKGQLNSLLHKLIQK